MYMVSLEKMLENILGREIVAKVTDFNDKFRLSERFFGDSIGLVSSDIPDSKKLFKISGENGVEKSLTNTGLPR